MDFRETKKVMVSLLKYLPKEQMITLCETLDQYFKTKKRIPIEQQKGITFPLSKDGYVLHVQNDEIFSECQQTFRVQKEGEPVLILTALPDAILKNFVFDIKQFVGKYTQEELNGLSSATSDLSFYNLTSQLKTLIELNNSSFDRAGALLQHQLSR